MSEADKLFKKLGYKMKECYNGFLYTNQYGFNIKITNNNRVDLFWNEGVIDYEVCENLEQLTFEEIQAIYKKCKELRFKGVNYE